MNTVNRSSSVLVVFGSPHRKGNTAKFLDLYLNQENIQNINLFNCFKSLPIACNDCGYCKTHDHCVLPDLKDFYTDFEKSEHIIIATPIYNGSFPAPLKALIDRLQVYYNARFHRELRPPIAIPKKLVLLLTSGSNKDQSALILEQLKPIFTITNCSLLGYAILNGTDKEMNGNDYIKSLSLFKKISNTN